jgi:hypothetical protein
MCPTTDGAGAVLLSPEKEMMGRTAKAYISGFGVACDYNHIYHRAELDVLHATTAAARKAYGMAGIPLEDLDGMDRIPEGAIEGLFFQNHDAFGPLYLMNLIHMGFCREGDMKESFLQGHFDPLHENCIVPVNMCGGFKDGHPVGATGLIKFIEAYRQIAGEAECLQLSRIVKNFTPLTAIQNSIGGPGSCNAVVVIDHIDNPPRQPFSYPGLCKMMAGRSKVLPVDEPPWKGCFVAGTRRYLRESGKDEGSPRILDMAIVHLDTHPENLSTRLLVTPDNLPKLEYGDPIEIYRAADGKLRCR